MEIQKPNDILIATINNPNSSTYDLMSAGLTPDNTSLFANKDDYKQSNYIKDIFKTEDGKFDDVAFDNFYNLAATHYNNMADESYIKSLEEVEYSPFDITRPREAKTFKVGVEFQKEINPFREVYSRTGINSVDESTFSLREIAQQEKIYDPKTNTWSEQSANDLSLIDKLFGETLVYAQWDEDGTHQDIQSGQIVKHKKGDWKINDDGNLYLEKLAGREIYGKQVVNPMDMLTTDGSFANQLDIFDSDSKEKSILKTTFKIAFDIAPFIIPVAMPAAIPLVGGLKIPQIYGGIKAAVGLASVMPTFFKSLDGILNNDNSGGLANSFTAAEGYMAKFTANSISDRGQKSLFTYEQMSQMVGDIFSQIYEQRAAASLSKLFGRTKELQITEKQQELIKGINKGIIDDLAKGKITIDKAEEVSQIAKSKIPELANLYKSRSGLSKSLSLGYMALTSTGQIYSEALEGGYDRRTAGFAALAAAAGQYGIMMNNRMGDWFLDESTGYTSTTHRSTISKAVKEYLEPIKKGLDTYMTDPVKGKASLGVAFKGIKNKLYDVFTSPGDLEKALVRNAFVEGMEEVSEQVVLDATKGIFDTMSYLGLVKQKGTFGGLTNVFSREGLEEYLANFMGGVLGGAMFEFNRRKIDPWISGVPLPEDTKKSVYQLVANGHTDALIEEVNRQRNNLGNRFVKPTKVDGNVIEATPGQSESDLIADTAIGMIRNIDGLMRAKGLAISDKDIVNQAMIDHLIIKDLEASKSAEGIGIEGIIIDDFRNASDEIMKISSDIKKLSETKEKEAENKEEIKRLEEKGKLFEKKIEDIKSGKLAGDYYTQILFYLSKDISENWLNIDKVTYTKTKYNKNYYDLEEKGLGITKESLDKEWKDYIDSKDLRKSIEVATKAYLELEKKMNPDIAKYIESGYVEERKKTIKGLLDIVKTIDLFDVSNEKTKANSISNYIQIAKEVESLTKKRLIPWDVISTDVADKILSEQLLSQLSTEEGKVVKAVPSQEYLDKEIEINGEKKKRSDIIKDTLNLVLSNLPAQQLSYEMVADMFNYNVDLHNKQTDLKIQELESKKTPENEVDINAQIQSLQDRKLEVSLDSFQESKSYLNQIEAINLNLVSKLNELGLNPEQVTYINSFSDEEFKKVFSSYNTLLEDYAKTNNKEVSTLTEEEKVEALSGIVAVYNVAFPTDESLSNILKSDNSDKFSIAEEIINGFVDNMNHLKNQVSSYNSAKQNFEKDIKVPEIFQVNNYAIEAIIKEIKNSKNLDKELLLEVQRVFNDIILDIKNSSFKNIEFSNEQILDILTNTEDILNEVFNYTEELRTEYLGIAEPPSYITNVVNNSQDKLETALEIESGISKLLEYKKSNQKTLDKLLELKEIIDNKENFISNTVYDFLENFEIFLSGTEGKTKNTVFSVLKQEELSLFNSSDITNYISEGLRDIHMDQAINVIKMAKSVLLAMQTTEIDLGDPYGFVASRQAFMERNKIDSDVKSLKTITSDNATLMILDLNRLESKISFLKELAKGNAGKIYVEQENTRKATNNLMVEEWKRLKSLSTKINEKPLVPDLEEILSSSDSEEKKLLKVEEAFFEHYKDSSLEEKLEVIKELTREYKYVNSIDNLYNIDGSDRISKDIKTLNRNDFLLSLVASLVVNSRDFNNRLLNILNTEFDKSPFFTQELAVKIAYASIIQPELFAEIAKENKYIDAQVTDYITYILGDAGTGKTTVAFKSLVLLLQNNNPNMDIWFAAPHKEQATKLKSEVLEKVDSSKLQVDNTLNKNELFEKLGITKILEQINAPDSNLLTIEDQKLNINFENIVFDIPSDLPNLIFIDEITHFNAIELAVMNELTKRARVGSINNPGINMRIIGTGDPTQNGTEYIKAQRMYNVDWVSGIFTPVLSITVRALNSQKRTNNDHLSSIVKKSISVFETEKDTDKILDIIGNGISLKYYLNSNTLNGDILLSSSNIPINILNTLKNIITKNPDTKIGILSKGVDLSPELKEAFDSVGISSSNYRVYTESTVQGSESDYFIFDTNILNSKNIVRSLRKLYTYISRAKQGSIILNSGIINNEDESNLKILSIEQDFTDLIAPLREDIIQSNKKERINSLKALLDPNFNIIYDNFKFIQGEVILDEELDDNIFTNLIETSNKTDEDEEKEFLKIEDNFNYRVHTFYNDLNISYKISGNQVTLFKNPDSKINYGLSQFLDFKEGENETVVTLQDFKDITNQLVQLKYAIWKSVLGDGAFPKGNPLLSKLLPFYTPNDGKKAKLVLVKTKYNDTFNAPFDKKLDVQQNHLKTGDTNVGLFLKIELNDSENYYIHLAALPKIDTVNKFYGKNSKSAIAYESFLTRDDEVNEFEISKDKIIQKTSTRLLKDAETKNTLNDLSNIAGLKFYNGTSFTSDISYNIFPTGDTGFENFKQIYTRTTFGKAIPEDDLRRMYFGWTGKDGKKTPGYKGKPYAVISFVEDLSQAQVVLLKSKTRTIKDILAAIKNPYNLKNPKSAKTLIKSSPQKSNERKEIRYFTDSLFSGSQVLDMLINLAVDNPVLFNSFYSNGYKFLKEVSERLNKVADSEAKKEFIATYMSVIDGSLRNDLLSHIAYSNDPDDNLRSVFGAIKSAVEKYAKDGKPINKADLRKELLDKVKLNKTWFTKFWNLFSFRNSVSEMIASDKISLEEIKDTYTEFLRVMDEMIKYWDNNFPGIYFNVPITSLQKGTYQLAKSPSGKNWDYDFLYTERIPEGFYLSINLENEVTNKVDPTKDKIVELNRILNSIKYKNKLIIKPETTDTIDILENKISRATLIKDILQNPKNTEDFGNIYLINDIINLDKDDLVNIKKGLDNRSRLEKTDLEAVNNDIDTLKIAVGESSESYKLELLNALKYNLSLINSDELTQDDKDMLNAVAKNWDKIFPIIKDLSEDIFMAINTFNNLNYLTDGDTFEDFMIPLQLYLQDKGYLPKISTNPNIKIENIFSPCN